MLLAIGEMSGPVRFTGCDELARGIAAIFRGWNIREIPAAGAPGPAIRIRKTRRGYQRVSRRLSKPSLCRAKIRRGKVAAICGFHYEFVGWFAEENPELLYVHCAAAEFDGGLVVFPSTWRAGKSILSVQLAAAGARVFCDDVLPIGGSNNFGMALGILPRLRLPMPEGLDPGFRDFLRHRRGPRDSHHLYVSLTDDELAPFGTQAPVRGIVMLQRDPEANPELVPEEKSETLRQVISQNFALEAPALEILDRLQAITAEADCFTLRYANGEQAMRLLQAAFGEPTNQPRSSHYGARGRHA